MKADALRAGRGLLSTSVARDPTAGKGLRLDDNGKISSSLLNQSSYRKNTSKAVNTSTATTDLLNGEITVAGGLIGTTGLLRLTAFGDYLNNTGSVQTLPRFQVVLGGTTLLDSGTTGAGAGIAASATRGSWKIDLDVVNLRATNSQASVLRLSMAGPATFNGTITWVTGVGGGVSNGTAATSQGTNSSTAVDTSVAVALVLNVINGSASGSYETRLLGALVQII